MKKIILLLLFTPIGFSQNEPISTEKKRNIYRLNLCYWKAIKESYVSNSISHIQLMNR
jgi:hypothetical protein